MMKETMMNMNEIELTIDDSGRGSFFIQNAGKRIAEMEILIKDSLLTVFHTQVDHSLKGKGIAASLVASMAEYARGHDLKVSPRCRYVHAQFKRHPEQYSDIWKKD